MLAAVRDACADKYGDKYIVKKEECVGHVQKRMGTSLREYKRKGRGKKLDDGKTVGGTNRLTDKVLDKIQNYYGQAIRNNVGDLEMMRNDIWAIYKHMIENNDIPLSEQHNKCPKDVNSWCKYWVSIETGQYQYSGSQRLPSVFLKELEAIFNRLSNDEPLKRYLMGLTQNQNEAINNVLWSICLKTKLCGLQKVLLAVSETIMKFNMDASSRALIMEAVGITPGINFMESLHVEDDYRVYNSTRNININIRLKRRKLRAAKKSSGKKELTHLSGGLDYLWNQKLTLIVNYKVKKPQG